jgi:hypothetical protein
MMRYPVGAMHDTSTLLVVDDGRLDAGKLHRRRVATMSSLARALVDEVAGAGSFAQLE